MEQTKIESGLQAAAAAAAATAMTAALWRDMEYMLLLLPLVMRIHDVQRATEKQSRFGRTKS